MLDNRSRSSPNLLATGEKKYVIKSIEKVFTKGQKLKKIGNKAKSSEGLAEKEILFTNDLDNLCDIAHQYALTSITNPEDKAFLLEQREVGIIGCMDSVDIREIRGTKTHSSKSNR